MSAETSKNMKEAGEVARLLSYLVLLGGSIALLVESTLIPKSRFEILGAGAFPILIYACLILLLSASSIASIRKLPKGALPDFFKGIGQWAVDRRLVFSVFACLGLYLTAMSFIGFRVSTFFFLLVLQIILGPKTRPALIISVINAVVFSFGLEYLFSTVFNVFLPRGM